MVQQYFLAIQRMPGDYKFIEISKLSIANGYNPTSLAEIDSFTCVFKTEEIRNAIIEANLVDSIYFDGTITIQDNQKHNPLKLITKDYLNDFKIDTFFISVFGNKEIINNITYKFNTLADDEYILNVFKDAIKLEDPKIIMNILNNIDYLIARKFVLYLIDLNEKILSNKMGNKQELVRDKAA